MRCQHGDTLITWDRFKAAFPTGASRLRLALMWVGSWVVGTAAVVAAASLILPSGDRRGPAAIAVFLAAVGLLIVRASWRPFRSQVPEQIVFGAAAAGFAAAVVAIASSSGWNFGAAGLMWGGSFTAATGGVLGILLRWLRLSGCVSELNDSSPRR